MRAMPKRIYVKWENPGDGEDFLVATETFDCHAVIGEKVRVGIYELKVTSTLTAKPELA